MLVVISLYLFFVMIATVASSILASHIAVLFGDLVVRTYIGAAEFVELSDRHDLGEIDYNLKVNHQKLDNTMVEADNSNDKELIGQVSKTIAATHQALLL